MSKRKANDLSEIATQKRQAMDLKSMNPTEDVLLDDAKEKMLRDLLSKEGRPLHFHPFDDNFHRDLANCKLEKAMGTLLRAIRWHQSSRVKNVC